MVITLTTDWGNDYFTGIIRGAIMCRLPGIPVIDLAHNIPSFSIIQAAFAVRNAYQCFPEGSVHILGVNNEYSEKTPHVAVLYGGHYFLGTDNGIFNHIFEAAPDKAVCITRFNEMPTFSVLSTFVPAAVHIAENRPFEKLGEIYDMRLNNSSLQPIYDSFSITGIVIYIDSFGNLVTNISRDFFEQVRNGRDFAISFLSKHYNINRISFRYSDVNDGEFVAVFNSMEMLEIAVNNGSIKEMLGFEQGMHVRIKFSSNPDPVSGTLFDVL